MRSSSAVPALLFIICLAVGAAIGAAVGVPAHDPALFAGPTALGFVAGLFFRAAVRIVSQWEKMVVLRLGRFKDVADPGLRLILPVIDSPLFVDMRVQTVDVSKQQAITQDNVPVLVNGVIFFRVSDPEAASLKVLNYWQAVVRLAQATLRDVVGKLTLDEVLSGQERLEKEIAQGVEVQSKAWGVHIEAIKLEDIDMPEELKKMMARQASSEREKRATIIKADGDRQAAAALSEAATTMAKSPGAMQLRVLQTLDGLGPSASNTVVLAVPLEVIESMRAYVASHKPD